MHSVTPTLLDRTGAIRIDPAGLRIANPTAGSLSKTSEGLPNSQGYAFCHMSALPTAKAGVAALAFVVATMAARVKASASVEGSLIY
jgi:hypothetical protein